MPPLFLLLQTRGSRVGPGSRSSVVDGKPPRAMLQHGQRILLGSFQAGHPPTSERDQHPEKPSASRGEVQAYCFGSAYFWDTHGESREGIGKPHGYFFTSFRIFRAYFLCCVPNSFPPLTFSTWTRSLLRNLIPCVVAHEDSLSCICT